MAHRLAKKQRRTVSQVVEHALEIYAKSGHEAETARDEQAISFWQRINRQLYPTGSEPDVDLETIIQEHRRPQRPVKL